MPMTAERLLRDATSHISRPFVSIYRKIEGRANDVRQDDDADSPSIRRKQYCRLMTQLDGHDFIYARGFSFTRRRESTRRGQADA